jgi:hypothetical protein
MKNDFNDDLDRWTRGRKYIYSENPNYTEYDVPGALRLLEWAKVTITTAVDDPDHSELAIMKNGTKIMKGLEVIGGWNSKFPNEQHLACHWAMRRNHRGILRLLDDTGYFFRRETCESGYRRLHETLIETVERGNFDAIAVVLGAMGTKVDDATIGTILLNLTVRLSSSFATPAALGVNAIVANWRNIEVLFLAFQKILGPRMEFFAQPRVGPTVVELQAIRHNIDAMEALLFVAVQLCPQNVDAVRSLLQTTKYSARALHKAIMLSGRTLTDIHGGCGLHWTGKHKWNINNRREIINDKMVYIHQRLRDEAKAIQEDILQLLVRRLRSDVL